MAGIASDVWVIYPDKQASRFRGERAAIRDECNAQGWVYQERPTRRVSIHPGGRFRDVLDGNDATTIYRRAHRARVALIVFAQSHILLHPVPQEAIRKNAIARLQHFFEYKCFVELLASHAQCSSEWIKGFADRFATASLTAGCENELDPRCLPLHVFANRRDHDLFLREGRAGFDRQYGIGGHRSDLAGRQWRLSPLAYHGHEVLFVAGSALPRGFHWDVEPGGKKTLITTTRDVWLVSRYVNVYPDSHIRGDRPHAQRVA